MFCKIKEKLHDKKYAKPIIFLLFLVSVVMIYKNQHSKEEEISNIIPIEATAAKISELPIYISSLGTVTANNIVNIKTQINGQITKIAFNDGQHVKKDDLLIQIDPSIYKAQVEQYQGQLGRDQAILENSKLDLERYQELWAQNSVSKQTLDTQIALVKQNEGTVLLDEGLLDNAKINLLYCDIKAPFDGKVGIANASEGTLVQSSDQNAIVTITSIDPILVLFSVPEIELPTILTEFKKSNLIVEAYDQGFKTLLATGKLEAIDNQIDTSTGTIKLKSVFNNENQTLFPNQFVNTKLLVKNLERVLIIPSPAIQYGPHGTFVYLVDKDKTNVNVRPVVVGLSSGTNTVIESGIEEGDLVAVTGVDKLEDNSSIIINNKEF